MATFPLPQIPLSPQSETLLINSKQTNQSSPYSGRQTVVQYFSSWTLSIGWPRMTLGRAEVLAAWMDSLQGAYGSFFYCPIFSVYPVAAALVLAADAYATSNVASVSGWQPNASTGIRVGQYVAIGTQLLRVAAVPLNADANGKATVEFNPPLRANYGAGTVVETANPRGIFRLDSSSGSGYQLDPDRAPEFQTMNAIEVI